ncbi:MAG: SDR family NAD(P)-dependent oxidoreductase [Chitinophagaceae bacterium]
MKKVSLLVLTLFIILDVYAQSDAMTENTSVNRLLDATDTIYSIPSDPPGKNLKTGYATSGIYALVAGGSKGIGYAIAEALAKRKYNLILIARHSDSLLAAKNKLESQYQVHVETLKLDLEKEEAADSIARWCTLKDIHLKMLCNVAGFGGARDYLSLPLDTLRYMVRLNVESCMALSLTLLPLLEKNAPSYILNVASMAGFAPIPVKNIYSATKSAVIFFSYSLRYQLKKKNISVSCLSPGPVFTKPEIEKDTKKKLGWFGVQMAVPPNKVGEIAVRKTLKRRMLIVPGTLPKITSFIIRILPRRWIVAIYSKVGNK